MIGAPSPREHLAALATMMPRLVRASRFGVIAGIIGLVGTVFWVVSTRRLYHSEAALVYEHAGQSTGLAGEAEAPRHVATRLQDMVLSRQRLEGLIREMNLYPKVVDKKGMVEAIEELRRRLNVVNREGYAFRVSYDAESRDLAKAVLDKVLASVLAEDSQRRTKEAMDAKRFLDSERAHADEDLKTKEGELAAFLAKHPQLASEAGGAATAGSLIRAADRDRIGASGSEVASLELQAAQLEESIAAAAAGRRPNALGEPVADPQLIAAHTRAQTELQAAQRELVEKQAVLTNEHPDVKQALRRLAHAEATERRAAAALAAWRPAPAASPANGPPSGAGDPTAALRRSLAAVKQQLALARSRSAPRTETPKTVTASVAIDTEFTRLNREVSEARERQNQIEGKQFHAQLAATLAAEGHGGRLVIVDPPFKPMKPVAGGHFKVALVGGVLSLLLGLLVIGIFAAFDDRLYGARDIQGLLGDGIIVVVPKVPRDRPAEGKSG